MPIYDVLLAKNAYKYFKSIIMTMIFIVFLDIKKEKYCRTRIFCLYIYTQIRREDRTIPYMLLSQCGMMESFQ
jgi:hypothetical protein